MSYKRSLKVPVPDTPCPNCAAVARYRRVTVDEYNVFATGYRAGVALALSVISDLFATAFKRGPVATAAELTAGVLGDEHIMGTLICEACRSFIAVCPHCVKASAASAGYMRGRWSANCPHCNNLISM
jgi:phage terminase large subunit GpA-like protein